VVWRHTRNCLVNFVGGATHRRDDDAHIGGVGYATGNIHRVLLTGESTKAIATEMFTHRKKRNAATRQELLLHDLIKKSTDLASGCKFIEPFIPSDAINRVAS